MGATYQYGGRMRRLWLTFITAFALAAGGVANASATACPMEQGQVAAAPTHDCCPDNHPADHQTPQNHNMDGCLMGAACGAVHAIAPATASGLVARTVALKQPLVNEVRAPAGPLQDLFRPPRSI